MSLLLWSLACVSTETTAPVVTPPPVEQAASLPRPEAASTSDRVYVRASSLNLRAAAEPQADLVGRLRVNSPLTVLERKEGWLRVRVDNGKEGWVASEFVADAALTVDEALANAREGTAAEQLGWWQRAAALDSRSDVLEGLAAAYEAVGHAGAARQVREQLSWPVSVVLPSETYVETRHGGIFVEWHTGYGLGPDRVIPEDEWRDYGLDPTEPWWALTAAGVAIPAKPVGMQVSGINDCSGEVGRLVELKVETDERVVVLHRGNPPGTWREALSSPKIPLDAATARARELAAARSGGKPVEVQLVPTEGAWVGTAEWPTGEYNELGMDITEGLYLKLGETEVVRDLAPIRGKILAERDVLGSGTPVTIATDDCMTLVFAPDGTLVQHTAETCCGC